MKKNNNKKKQKNKKKKAHWILKYKKIKRCGKLGDETQALRR